MLQKNKITHIVDCVYDGKGEPFTDTIKYLSLSLDDYNGQEISLSNIFVVF